jgi:thioredoxin reductase (NADPH)
LIDEVLKNPKIEVLFSVNVLSFEGEEHLESLSYQIKNGKIIREEIDGVFVAIGTKPNSDIFKKHLSCDENGYIITDSHTKETSIKGVFAAGDVQETDYRQAVVACSSGAVAALSAERYLLK